MLSPVDNIYENTGLLTWYVLFTHGLDEYNAIPFLVFISYRIHRFIISHVKSLKRRHHA